MQWAVAPAYKVLWIESFVFLFNLCIGAMKDWKFSYRVRIVVVADEQYFRVRSYAFFDFSG